LQAKTNATPRAQRAGEWHLPRRDEPPGGTNQNSYLAGTYLELLQESVAATSMRRPVELCLLVPHSQKRITKGKVSLGVPCPVYRTVPTYPISGNIEPNAESPLGLIGKGRRRAVPW
jgi:hypothetical protein